MKSINKKFGISLLNHMIIIGALVFGCFFTQFPLTVLRVENCTDASVKDVRIRLDLMELKLGDFKTGESKFEFIWPTPNGMLSFRYTRQKDTKSEMVEKENFLATGLPRVYVKMYICHDDISAIPC